MPFQTRLIIRVAIFVFLFIVFAIIRLARIELRKEEVDVPSEDNAPNAGLVLPNPSPPTPKVGLAQSNPTPNRPAKPPGPITSIQGGTFDPEFRDMAPDGGILVGLEIGLGKYFQHDIVVSLRPVYLLNGVETVGIQHGTDLSRVVRLVAKPGYAIGAITVKTGLGLDGISARFMKISKDKLNTEDSYESEWIGGPREPRPVKLGGDGTPIVGILGKLNQSEAVSGLGLQLQTVELR